MLRRRIAYLVSLIGCFGFYIAYGAWLSWLLLMAVVFLPLLSLLLSLPAMLLVRAQLPCPHTVRLGEQIPLKLEVKCPLPAPLTSWYYRVSTPYTGELRRQKDGKLLIAEHCGCIRIELRKPRKYDYLGLFRWRLCRQTQQAVLVWPTPVPVGDMPSLKRYLAARRIPKPGGGFAETYDLRLYRPGDNLRQIHWKLAAKTGKLVFREPTIPLRGKLIITMLLCGSPEELDTKLGKLLYVSQYLLKQELTHELHCLTGNGLTVHTVSDAASLDEALSELLCAPLTAAREMPGIRASWRYHIGGERNEA